MTRRTLLFITLLLGTTCAYSQQTPGTAQNPATAQPPASSTENAPSVQRDVPYGTAGSSSLVLDIYEPVERSSTARTAVVLIHGGGWINFDKSTMRGMGAFLARFGFVAFAVDYRLMRGTENRWPAQLDDVQRAVRWIRANAAKYNIDPNHIGAFGHSAGAQLAALLGMEDTRDNSDAGLAKYSSKVQAVVDVSGPTDFTTHHDADADEFLSAFFGADYSQHPEIWREASPVFHVSKNSAPFLIFHGTQDEAVPLAQAQELADKLKEAHAPVTLVKVDDGHTFEKPDVRKRLAVETRDFFLRYLK